MHSTHLSSLVCAPGCSGKRVPRVYEHPDKVPGGTKSRLEKGGNLNLNSLHDS